MASVADSVALFVCLSKAKKFWCIVKSRNFLRLMEKQHQAFMTTFIALVKYTKQHLLNKVTKMFIEQLRTTCHNQENLYAAYGLNNATIASLIDSRCAQLDELQNLVRACEEMEERIRRSESDEEMNKAATALQPLLEKFEIRDDISTKESVSFAPEVADKKEEVAVDPFVEDKENGASCNFLFLIDQDQYAAVPTYLKGRMTVSDLNATITVLDTQMGEKATLMKKPLKTLKQADKNRVMEWKKQNTEKCQGNIWLTEAELKASLNDRLKSQLKHSLPVMRHFRITKEIREKNCLFICPFF